MIRCDQCDNGMIAGWLFCPYCGYPQSDEGIEAAQRELTARQQAQAEIYRLSKKLAEQPHHADEGVADSSFWEEHFSKPKMRRVES